MQVLIAGCGPAGLMLADAMSQRGLQVMVVAPDFERKWEPVFGDWREELERARLGPYIEREWKRASFFTARGGEQEISRAYARLDSLALQAALLREVRARGVTLIEDEVTGVTHQAEASTASLAKGAAVECALFVDATGQSPRFVREGARAFSAFQTAYGIEATFAGVPFAEERMVLMDYRDLGWPDDEPPSFLYAMPLGERRWFFEETVLVAKPALPISTLEARLQGRLRRLGVTTSDVKKVERCWIPMDPALPDLKSRTGAYGSAAALVHPASGYQLATAAIRAPRVAEAVAALMASGVRADALSAGYWSAVWTADEIRVRNLLRFGADMLQDFAPDDLRAFFSAFFRISAEHQGAYMSYASSSVEVAQAMWAVFRKLRPGLKLKLIQGLKQHGDTFLGIVESKNAIRPRT